MYALLTPAGGQGISAAPPSPATAAVAGTAGAKNSQPITTASAPLELLAAGPVAHAEGPIAAGASPIPAAATPIPAAASPAQRRLNFLFQASVHLSTKSPTLSRVLLLQLHEVARKHVLRLHASVKHSCCSSCFSLLLPQNTRVRQYIQGCRCCSNSTSNSSRSACSTFCYRANVSQRIQVKRPKWQDSQGPTQKAVPRCSLGSGRNSSTSPVRGEGNRGTGADFERPCLCVPAACRCCGSSSSCSCYCCCRCRIEPEGKHRRGRRRGRAESAVPSEQQQQLLKQQQPLMEVRCLVCGYVSRRP